MGAMGEGGWRGISESLRTCSRVDRGAAKIRLERTFTETAHWARMLVVPGYPWVATWFPRCRSECLDPL